MTTVEEKTGTLTWPDLFRTLWPAPPSHHAYLRLIDAGHRWEWYFCLGGRWRQLGPFKAGEEPGPERLLVMNNGRGVCFNPALRSHAAAGSPPVPMTAVWAGAWLPLERRKGEPAARLQPGAREAARARLLGASVPPSLLLDEGVRVLGLWLLDKAVPVETGHWLLAQLARRLDCDRTLDLERAEMLLPGVHLEIFPPRDVIAEAVAEPLRRVRLEELAAWLDAV
jgi:hypothetical protein